MRLAGEMDFPWLMSNVKSAETGRLLAEGQEYYIIQWDQWKVGSLGGSRGKEIEGEEREGGSSF